MTTSEFRTKTIYIKPQDRWVFQQAEILVGPKDSVSGLIVELMKGWIADQDPTGTRRKAIVDSQVHVKTAVKSKSISGKSAR